MSRGRLPSFEPRPGLEASPGFPGCARRSCFELFADAGETSKLGIPMNARGAHPGWSLRSHRWRSPTSGTNTTTLLRLGPDIRWRLREAGSVRARARDRSHHLADLLAPVARRRGPRARRHGWRVERPPSGLCGLPADCGGFRCPNMQVSPLEPWRRPSSAACTHGPSAARRGRSRRRPSDSRRGRSRRPPPPSRPAARRAAWRPER